MIKATAGNACILRSIRSGIPNKGSFASAEGSSELAKSGLGGSINSGANKIIDH